MRKIKLKPPKVKRFKTGTPIIFCPDPLDYMFLTQRTYDNLRREKEREFYSDIWGRMLATLRGERYEADYET